MRASRAGRIAFFSSVALVCVLILASIRGALFPIVFSLFLAYVLNPAADFFESLRIPRSLAILIILIIVGGILFAAVMVLIPVLQKEVQRLVENLPVILSVLEKNVVPLVEKYLGRKVPMSLQDVFNDVIKASQGLSPESVRPMARILQGAFAGLLGLLTGLLALILIPVLTFFFLRDFNALTHRIALLFPKDVKPWLVARFREVDDVLGGFVRGQLTVCLIMAVLYSGGLSVIGIDLSVLIGTIGGIGLIIPYVGAAVAVILSVVMSLATFGPDVHILYILAWFGFVHLWEAYLITPTIVGHRVGLSPLGVILSLYIGGETLGLLGLLLAVPSVAVLRVFFLAGLESYRRSPFFRGR